MRRPWKLGTLRVIARPSSQNAVFCEEGFPKNRTLYVHISHTKHRESILESHILKLKINVSLPQLLHCMAFSAAQNGELIDLVGFASTITARSKKETRVESSFWTALVPSRL